MPYAENRVRGVIVVNWGIVTTNDIYCRVARFVRKLIPRMR